MGGCVWVCISPEGKIINYSALRQIMIGTGVFKISESKDGRALITGTHSTDSCSWFEVDVNGNYATEGNGLRKYGSFRGASGTPTSEQSEAIIFANGKGFMASRTNSDCYQWIWNTAIYSTSGVYESNKINEGAGTVSTALFYVESELPTGTTITYEATANDSNWETITPGTVHSFTNTGNVLKFRANMTTSDTSVSPHITSWGVKYG